MLEIIARVNAGEAMPEEYKAQVETSARDARVYFDSLKAHMSAHLLAHPDTNDGVFAALVRMAAIMAIELYGMTPDDFAAFAWANGTQAKP